MTGFIHRFIPQKAQRFGLVLGLAAALNAAPMAQADSLSDLTAEFSNALKAQAGVCETKAKLGIWPFDPANQPISAAAADQLYGDLLANLIAQSGGCFDVMDGNGIGAVLAYLHKTGALRDAGGNPVAALEAANQEVDIVALPQLAFRNGIVSLALKAVAKDTGQTIAQTARYDVPAQVTASAMVDTARDLEAALADAARALADQTPDMNRLVPVGVFYQGSGAQPDFGRYFQDRLITALVEGTSNTLTDRSLQIIEPEFDLSPALGASLSARDLDPLTRIADRDGSEGLYQLRGTYWVFDTVIDLTLTLLDADGGSTSWQTRLRRDQLGDIAVAPRNAGLDADIEGTDSFAILMTSPKGDDPVYHPGEELVVYFRADRRVWLYCFYIDAVGDVTQVLPNLYRKDFADGHMLTPFVLHALPDPRKDPFRFRINADTLGEERLKCMATTRNVTDDLPEVLRGISFDPIATKTAAQIDTIFADLPDTRLSSASVTITIAPSK
ncbi:DUF4384 domain-containing protein [Pelagimonas varians]|uniref:DUF4384 domain-containing protein n=1 Tax=Pelagimonas varians TaxID=696760 RepID=A0A238JU48_9RHOB|nr:DUF4384 domain-containing protein [Pelagimonas varians]PYG34523.1 uncharacterized protein DUF4384 [Pelagimonas varians]SMX33714.1 hypothetical protein PEV8663_00292 [Pelagimonas varians]